MNRRLVLMSAAAAVLGAYVLLGEGGLLSGLWQRPAVPDGLVEAVAPLSGTPREGVKLNPLEGLDPAAYAAIVDQPLFNPGRAPRPEEAPPPPPDVTDIPELPPEQPPAETGPVASDYRLLAVSSGPAGRVAALRLNQTGEVVYVREGQEVQQWQVLAVGPRSLTLGTPEQNVELAMFENTGEAVTVPEDEDGGSPEMPVPPDMPVPADPVPESGN